MTETHASKPIFVYTIYIASSPEKVFKALTDTDATAKFWFGNAATSDWKVGSPVEFHRDGRLILKGRILENNPPRRLSYTFEPMHTEALLGEKPSRVVLDIEPQKDQVKLTITHDDFPEGTKVFAGISNGWPLILSSLKSYLEASRVLYAPWDEKKEKAAAS